MRITLDELDRRIEAARSLINPCRLCPRECLALRVEGETGHCAVTADLLVSSVGAHFGEEPELVGRGGSGTIFFAGCNLLCSFCQNHDISHHKRGERYTVPQLAAAMLALQHQGCHNLNIVTPTHYVTPLLEALKLAGAGGLAIPLVYNCGGYESLETLRLLDGVVDIYMPDIKFASAAVGRDYCGVPDYPERARAALQEMHRQVGVLTTDEGGVAVRGLLIRHLVLPGGLAGSERSFQFIARELSPDSYVNVMAQYRPCCDAVGDPRLGRSLTADEFQAALAAAHHAGLHRGF
jgi:putative pyruvate formate lyase activating enzyme